MKKETICFTGHRKIRKKDGFIRERLTAILEDYILSGCLYFAAGGSRGFDGLAAEVVLELQYKYPQIGLILILPFKNQYTVEKGWTEEDIEQYKRNLKGASEVVYIGETYKRGCYYKRNRLLVQYAHLCIAYRYRDEGGTAYTIRYAEDCAGIPVLNLL